jgi:hypothetical protein
MCSHPPPRSWRSSTPTEVSPAIALRWPRLTRRAIAPRKASIMPSARQVGAVDAYPRSCVDGLVAISGGVVSPNSLRRGGCGRYLQPLQAGSSTRRSACRPSTCSAGSALWSVARSVCLLQPELRRYASTVRRRFGQPAALAAEQPGRCHSLRRPRSPRPRISASNDAQVLLANRLVDPVVG